MGMRSAARLLVSALAASQAWAAVSPASPVPSPLQIRGAYQRWAEAQLAAIFRRLSAGVRDLASDDIESRPAAVLLASPSFAAPAARRGRERETFNERHAREVLRAMRGARRPQASAWGSRPSRRLMPRPALMTVGSSMGFARRLR